MQARDGKRWVKTERRNKEWREKRERSEKRRKEKEKGDEARRKEGREGVWKEGQRDRFLRKVY